VPLKRERRRDADSGEERHFSATDDAGEEQRNAKRDRSEYAAFSCYWHEKREDENMCS
jgi:hypothetical protein